MPRKIQRLLTCKEGYRRSPRLCSLDSWKKAQKSKHVLGERMGPSRPKGGRKTRDLSTVDELDNESSKEEYHPTNIGNPKRVVRPIETPKKEDEAIPTCQQSLMQSDPRMPAKCMLQLVLDILQKRDTNEIFAEPVDPNEVEDYYDLIDEPMDFGTMRAKLHEGMYKNLEQFERDVFLITRNAMHFNASGTMYFRQARAIDELSKKVFHVLKTEPEKLESEFSSTRRRPGRRPQAESSFSLSRKRGLSLGSSNMGTNLSLKGAQCSLDRPSKSRTTFQATPTCFSSKATLFTSPQEVRSGGAKDNRWSCPVEYDQRSTYKPWTCFNMDYISSFSTTSSNPKMLTHVKQQDFSYSESLMTFSKKLGPIAQMIAKRKLQLCMSEPSDYQTLSSTFHTEAPKFQMDAEYFSSQWRTCPPSKNINCTGIRQPNREEKPCSGILHAQISEMDWEFSQSNFSDLIAKNRNDSRPSSLWPIKPMEASHLTNMDDLNLQLPPCTSNGNGSSSKTNQVFELNQMGSQYAYDLPYLKSRLSQMNSFQQQDLYLRQCSNSHGAIF